MKTGRENVKGELRRVDHCLSELFPSLSQRQIEEALSHGDVTLSSGKRVKKGERIGELSELDVRRLVSHLEKLRLGNPGLEIPILVDRDDVLVIDKPAGVASHPVSLYDENTVTHWAFSRFPKLRDEFCEIQPTLSPHRLDIGTSGLLIVAKTAPIYEKWRGRFREKMIQKEYLAWCWGAPSKRSFEITVPLAHDPTDPRKMIPVGEAKYRGRALAAFSEVQLEDIRPGQDMCLVRVTCRTGVTHQVRVHLASVGLPLVGEPLYDPKYSQRVFRPPHHLLRAVKLTYEQETFVADEQEFRKGVE